MITCVLGVPGSGKTLYMLWLMGEFVKAGRPVATNIVLTPACPFYDRVLRLDADDGSAPVFREPDKERGLSYSAFWHYLGFYGQRWAIFIDEADNYWDSMDFKGVAKDVRFFFKQHRKLEWDVVLAVQNQGNLYNRIRRMVQKWVVCEYTRRMDRLTAWLPRSWSKFVRGEFASEELTQRSYMGGGCFWYNEAKRMFTWYKTEQLIGDVAHYGWYRNGRSENVGTGAGAATGQSGVGEGRGLCSSGAEAALVAQVSGGLPGLVASGGLPGGSAGEKAGGRGEKGGGGVAYVSAGCGARGAGDG